MPRCHAWLPQVRGGIGGRRRVSIAEIGHVLRIFGVRMSDCQTACLCLHLSRGGRDGENCLRHTQTCEVVLNDLFNVVRPCLSQSRANVIEAVYHRIDSNGDGFISLGDVEASLSNIMLRYSYIHTPHLRNPSKNFSGRR
jgi:hypothetical protein